MKRNAWLVVLGVVLALTLLLWNLPPRPGKMSQRTPIPPDHPAPPPRLVAPSQPLPPAAPSVPSTPPPVATASAQLSPGQARPAFAAWAKAYLQAAAAERQTMLSEGLALAAARRPEFKRLIQLEPRRALEEAIPMTTRQQLPPEILARLEQPVNGRAALRVYQGDTFDTRPLAETVRVAEFSSGDVYQAHVYGRRAETTRWLAGVSLQGVALDRDLALHDDPSRPLEPGERPDPSKPLVQGCPICGQEPHPAAEAAPLSGDPRPAVEAFGEIHFPCDGTHQVAYRELLLQAEGSTGGPFGFTGVLPAVPTPSVGNVRVLVIPLTFADQNDVPSSESVLYQMMRDIGDHFALASYGKLTLIPTITPPIKLPHNEAWYVQKDTSNGGTIDGLGLEHSHARAEARALGYDDNQFDCVVVRLRGGPRATGGWGGGSSVWTYSDGSGVVAHELGHVFGLGHANFWNTSGTSAIGVGVNEEYGDSYDLMGGGGIPNGHYSPQGKNQVRWLPDTFLTEITTSGIYQIHAHDQPVLDPAERYALQIRKDSVHTYWGELRSVYTGSTSRPWADYGLVLGWKFSGGGGGYRQLIDTTPGSPFGKDDAPISLGRTFSDYEAGIHITALAVHPATNLESKSIDVAVNLGQFPSNHPPLLSLTASATIVPVNVPVTFTAVASDPDGDLLAYSWQHFGDANYRSASANAPTLTRSFTSAGTYVVTCTASDMKGGVALRNVLVTVGNGGSKYTLRGRITLEGQGLAGVLVNANSANGVVTDSDGWYVIPNLSAATYVMTPLLYGYTFTELFNNSVTVGPDFAGANFEAAAVPLVSLTAVVPVTLESNSAAPARLLLTRTGDASQALTVSLTTPSGSATSGTDYSVSPALATGSQGFSTLTIPAGTNALAVNVTPINDSLAEGPETVILELAPGTGYLISGPARATVVIDDDDSLLPKVSLAVAEAKTIEGSDLPARITFTRSGATTNALVVPYAVGGTATPGSDYLPLTGSLTLPIGATSASLPILTVNDETSESVETVSITIANSTTFLADPLAKTATVSLIDDDVQTVIVTAPDAVATERNLAIPGTAPDTATFLITRSGDLSAPLTVYYAVSGVTGGSTANALHGVDYEALPGVLVIPAGQASGAVTIVPIWDTLGEGPETVSLQLGAGPTNYRVGASDSATITINDAGDPPYVDVIGVDNAVEGGTSGRFRFSLQGSAAGSVVIYYTVSGTATSGSDFTALPGSVTLTGTGLNTVEVTVTPLNDTLAEDLETITVTITPNTNYQVFPPTGSATIWMMDNEQPTLFVDANNTGYPPSITENGTGGSFYISRTGSTTGSLTVNYTLSGTAQNGVDYQLLSGTTNIAAGALGVDIPIIPIDDSLAEGTETIILSLAPGAYGRGPAATLYLTDNETPALTVGFPSASSNGLESLTSVNIPVTLSAASASAVSVEYTVETGSRSTSTATGTAPSLLPYWVRCDRLGGTLIGSISPDGTNWTGVSTQAIALPNSGFLVGLYVCSYNSSLLCTSVFDNVLVTNLPPNGVQGTRFTANIGSTSVGGSAVVAGGTYTVYGAGDNVEGTTDQGTFTWWPINNGSNCTIIARVVSQQNTYLGATAGVMIRESSANNVRRGYMAATPGRGFEFHSRTTVGGSDDRVNTIPAKPLWVRLQRSGALIRAYQSGDGLAWSQVSTNLDLGFGPEVLAGLTVSAQAEGSLATAAIDNVSLSPGPLPNLEGFTVGFSAIQGTHSLSDGVFSLSGSADGLNNTSDDCYFLSAPVSGDFTLTARITSLQSSASSPQAGVCVRESTGRRVRSVYLGGQPGTAPQLAWRSTSVTLANGSGIDYVLSQGLLTFPAGSLLQNIPLQIVNDTRPEPDEVVTLVLRNPTGARLGRSEFTYLIVDDDLLHFLPFLGFAASSSSAPESAGTVFIPVTLSAAANASLSVDYAIAPGSATAGQDFLPATGTLTFAPGDTVQSIPLHLLDDALIESAETIVVTLSNPVNALTNNLVTHTFTVVDDDTPVVTISATDTNATEAGDTALLTLTRSGSAQGTLTVGLARSGTATAGTDYSGIGTSATFPDGVASLALTLTPIQDSTSEPTETAIISLSAGPGYVVGSPSSVTLFIADDDRNTVFIAATTPTAAEGGAPGTFTLTRSGSTNATLTVALTVTGTASSGADYYTTPSSLTTVSFSPGQDTRVLTITPINDSLTEGDEAVLVQIGAGSYDIGGLGYASLTLVDNDIPPTVFISSPTVQGLVLAPGNGLEFAAQASDDGSPQPLSYFWTQVSGPGPMVFGASNAATTPATFSVPGTYLVRVTVTDGQFTAKDQLYVTVGAPTNLAPADWISSDLGPTTLPGFSGTTGGNWVLSAVGTGFTSNSDRAHAVTRQVTGDGTIVARLLSVAGGSASEAGLSIRDSMHRYARRAVLVYQASSKTLRFRPRVTNNTTDFALSLTNLNLPLWLKLERQAASNLVAAFYATNQDGLPGPWIQLGTNVVIAMDATADYSLTADSGSDTLASTITFDSLGLTPAPVGPATLTEDFGDAPQVGVYSYNAATGTHTLQGDGSLDGSGLFWGQQFVGDFILTAFQTDATSSANDSRSGIMIRDTMDDGAMAFVGRNPNGAFSCYVWRTNPKGGTSGLSGISQKQRWLRFIRRGSTVTALHAPDNAGAPGTWIQLGQPQTVFMQPVVMAGLYCDNAGGVGFNTATFTKFSVVPLNLAPIVDAGSAPTNPASPLTLAGRVFDDGLPNQFLSQWTVVSAPGPVAFADPFAPATTARFSAGGLFTLRLWADDGLARSFDDLSFTAVGAPFFAWQAAHFPGGASNPNAAPDLDPDHDGQQNATEYATGTDPTVPNPSPLFAEVVPVGSNRFLRLTIPRNPEATDASLIVDASSELVPANWTTAGLVTETNTPTLLRLRDPVPTDSAPHRFLRLRTTILAP